MSNLHPVSGDIPLDEIDSKKSRTAEESQVKLIINESEKRRRRNTGAAAGDVEANFAAKRNVADGMMDLALLTANANQLRFLIAYNSQSSTFFVSMGLIVLSLVLQIVVGIGLIFKSKRGKRSRMELTNRLLIVGVLMITFVNILIAALTSTDPGQ